MPHEFEISNEIAVDATPEQVWEAIATGPGIDSWFMGRNQVEPREGGRTRMTMGGETAEGTVTAWDPPHRFAYRGAENPDGTFMAFEFLVEGREGGSTVVRLVHSGFLGDDWEAEYDALRQGDPVYMRKLAAYLKHFAGRTTTSTLMVVGPQVPDADRWSAAVQGALGLTGPVTAGAPVELTVEGLQPAAGVVEFANLPTYAVVCTDDGLYTFIRGFMDTAVVEHHSFTEKVDAKETEPAWQAWLTRSLA